MAKINDEYDIKAAFEAIENELIESMIRNMRRHKVEEVDEDKQWSMWQAEQLKNLEKYRRTNQDKFGTDFQKINARIEALIKLARDEGEMEQEIAILNAIKKGYTGRKRAAGATAEFFRLNEKKLDALIVAALNDMQRAETAILRMADDQYRKVIYNAQVYANTGAGTYEKAVDMATEDFLKSGLNCIEYANGARHTLKDYADMAIRTASKRAYLQGEGQKRQEWGITTVIMNKRGNPCPKCLPFCGKVLIDDVWSDGRSDGVDPKTGKKYPTMSYAISKGLYHPRCRDSHTTYFPGISTADDTWTKAELEDIGLQAKQEARQQYAERQIEKYERLAKYSLDEENQKKFQNKAKQWKRARFRTGEEDAKKYTENKEMKYLNGFSDQTEKWYEGSKPNSHKIKDLYEYTVNDVSYKVDGKNVLLDYKPKEKMVAECLEREFGGELAMVPRILDPQGISTPDYIFRGESFDLKELHGSSKNLIYNAISKKKRQSLNFVLDCSDCPLPDDEIRRQIEYVYWSRHTSFVDKIIVIKDNQVKSVFERNKR